MTIEVHRRHASRQSVLPTDERAAAFTAMLRDQDQGGDGLGRLGEFLGGRLSTGSLWCGWLDEADPSAARWRCVWSSKSEQQSQSIWIARASAAAVAAGGTACVTTPRGTAVAAVAPADRGHYLVLATIGPEDPAVAADDLQVAALLWSIHELARGEREQASPADPSSVGGAGRASFETGGPLPANVWRAMGAHAPWAELMQEIGGDLQAALFLFQSPPRDGGSPLLLAETPGETPADASTQRCGEGDAARPLDNALDRDRLLAAAADDALLAGEAMQWPADAAWQGGEVSLTLRGVASELGAAWALAKPVELLDGRWAVIIAYGFAATSPALAARLQRLQPYLQSRLSAESPAHRGARRGVGRRVWPRVAACAGALLAAAAACIPTRWEPAALCSLDAVTTRTISAPLNGLLVESLAEPGETVAKDQLLASLDGDRLRTELSGLRAELDRENKRASVAQAAGDWAAAQIARLEAQRINGRIDLLRRRMGDLEIRSPLEGVVVEAAQRGQYGAPLQAGQTLFVISSLENMRTYIYLSEQDASHALPGQQVRLRMDAFPMRTLTATLQQVHPRAELFERNNVFVAEALVQDSPDWLRPGMRGQAWLSGPYRPWIWNWLRRPLRQLRAWAPW